MEIKAGEIYGKRTARKMVMYSVLKVTKKAITLQNLDNPLSLFETTEQKLAQSGYELISQTPYIDTQGHSKKRKAASQRPARCPYTMDFLEGRADCEKPALPPGPNLTLPGLAEA